MAKNIEAQGIRVGYIIGGILAVLLSALLIVMYLPDFLTAVFGLPQIWDLYTPISELVGTNIMEFFNNWGAAGIMVLFFLIYFVCMSARQSKSATMFRLTGMFGALGCSLPFVATALKSMNLVDLTSYVGYGLLGTFVLAFIFYIVGLILRSKQKFHKNKASTTLVFCVTFWLLFVALQSLYYVGEAFGVEALTKTFFDVITFVNTHIFSILAIYLFISAIWMFLTVPHHVRVEYNADTPDMAKPAESIEEQAQNVKLSPEEEAAAKQRSTEAIKGSGAPVTQPLNVYPDKQNTPMPNPYRRKPIQPIPATPQAQPRPQNPLVSAQNFGSIRQVAPQNNVQQTFGGQTNNQMITPQNPYNPATPNALPNQYQPTQNVVSNYSQPRPAMPQPRPAMPQPRPAMPQPRPAMPQPRPAMPQPRPITQQNNIQQPYGSMPTNQAQQPRQYAQPVRPVAQPQQYGRPQPIRPAMQNSPNMAPNFFNPNQQQPRPYTQPYNPLGQRQRPIYPQQPNVANNPNNYIPNNTRPINPNNPNNSNNPNNPNNPNGNNGTNNGW